MLECWNEQPSKRPSFTRIKAMFDTMLLAEKKEAYIDLQFHLDEPYYRMELEEPSHSHVPPQIKYPVSVDSKPPNKSSPELHTPPESPRGLRAQNGFLTVSCSPSASSLDDKPWRSLDNKGEYKENKYVDEPSINGADDDSSTRQLDEESSDITSSSAPMHVTEL